MLINRLNGIINFNTSCTNYLINNKNFIINYSKKLGRPEWTVYSMNRSDLSKCNGGRKSFVYDKELIANNIYQLSPNANVFKNQWSRGHLIPSFIMSWDKGKNMSWEKTYCMSNIIPQHYSFNSINWQKLEIQTAKLIGQNSHNVHVITGCASFNFSNKIYFNNQIPHLRLLDPEYSVVWIDEKNNFEYQIPNLMYQVVITPFEIKSFIGFNNCKQKIYQVNIEYLEKMIGTRLLV